MSQTRRIDQQLARTAAGMLPETIKPELRTRYRQLPVRLRTSGLAATYAFLIAKSGTDDLGRAYGLVADGLRQHLITGRGLVDGARVRTNSDLVAALADLPTPVYLRAAQEAEALAGWLSRLADARAREQETLAPSDGSGGPS